MLHAIPDEDLAPAFARGLERLEQGEAFGAIHVREGWKDLKRERAEARAAEHQTRGLNYKAEGITFAQWWATDQQYIQANIPPEAQAKMQEIFDKRTKDGGVDWSPPPAKDCYVEPPQNDPRYCLKCRPLSGLYWDEAISKYRCCECEGGREKAMAIWNPQEYKRRKKAGEFDRAF
jgi:hypothetical protein